MGARFRGRHINKVIVGGVVRKPVSDGQAAGGGHKVRAWLDNPCDDNERFDLHIQLRAVGRIADELMEKAQREANVTVVGELTSPRTKQAGIDRVLETSIIVQEIFED